MDHTLAQSPESVASALGSGEREWINGKASAQARRAAEARKESGRRGGVDPATCDREYSPDEMEFMQAMQAYKARSGRMFPTWSEVLEVLRELGYEKREAEANSDAQPVGALSA